MDDTQQITRLSIPESASRRTMSIWGITVRTVGLRHIRPLLRLSIAMPSLIVVAAAADRTLSLPDPGRGLFKHYGFWVIVLTTPLLLRNVELLVRGYVTTITALDQHFSLKLPDICKHELAYCVTDDLRALGLQTRLRALLVMLIMTGIIAVVLNVIAAQSPAAYYGHDVFDAARYSNGYVMAKLYLAYVWGVVYPIAFFYAVVIQIRLRRLQRVLSGGRLQFEPFHPDGCGGVSRFGWINRQILSLFALPWLTALMLYGTHRVQYQTLIVGSLATTALGVWSGLFGVRPARQFVATQRDVLLRALASRVRQKLESGESPADLLSFQRGVAKVRVSAYRRGDGSSTAAIASGQLMAVIASVAEKIVKLVAAGGAGG